MKDQNNFRVQMMRVKGDLAPFVKVDYVDQDAKEHTALMVVDSCSCHNILFGCRAQQYRLVLQPEEGSMNVECTGNEIVTTSLATFHFVLGGEQFHESFGITEGDINIIEKVDDLPLVGVLGNIFMQQHCLAIDYSDYTLHTSDVSPENLPISACDFFFPMEIGLERYGLPVLAIRQNGNDLVALADTSATDNMIAMQSIKDNGFDCQVLDTTDVISGIGGEMEVRDAKMRFSLLTLTENDTEVVNHEDSFKVTSEYMITPEEGKCDKNGVQLPPVVGIIGSPFMAKEGWVLDFGVKYIYKRKTVMPVKMIARVPSRVEKEQSAAADKESKRSIPLFADPIEKGLPFIRIEEGDFEGLSHGNALAAPVVIAQVHGCAGFLGHQVVAAFPPFHDGTRAFGGQGQVEFIHVFHHFNQAFHGGGGAAQVCRNGAAGFQDGAQRPEEKALLHHDMGHFAELGIKQVAYQEIPHRSMGNTQYNCLGLFHGTANAFPAHFLEEPAAELGPAGAHACFQFLSHQMFTSSSSFSLLRLSMMKCCRS